MRHQNEDHAAAPSRSKGQIQSIGVPFGNIPKLAILTWDKVGSNF